MVDLMEIAGVSGEQWGMITTAQAAGMGFSRQRIKGLADNGVLERLQHGVYRLAGTPTDPLDEIRAAWLMLAPDQTARERRDGQPTGVVSHRSAAALVHRLGDLDADRIEFTVAERRQSRRPDLRFHQQQLDAGEWELVDGLPVTTVARTIVDLAEARTDGGHLAGAVRDALTADEVDPDELTEVLAPFAHYYGVSLGDGEALLRRFLEEAGVPRGLGRAVDLVTPSLSSQLAKFAALAEAAQQPAGLARLAARAQAAQRPVGMEKLARLAAAAQQQSAGAARLQEVARRAQLSVPPPREMEAIRRAIELAAPAAEQARRTAKTTRPKDEQ